MAQSTFVGQKTFDVKQSGTESEPPTSSKAAQSRKKKGLVIVISDLFDEPATILSGLRTSLNEALRDV